MAHSTTNVRGMQFTCDRTWESMAPMGEHRFCDSCQKPVIDFTEWSREELIAFFRSAPNTCGQFEPPQVDPSLIPLEDVGRGIRRGLFASLAALALNAAHAQTTRTPHPTEQVVHHPRPDDALNGVCERVPRSINRKESDSKSWVTEPKRRKPGKVRVYVSGSFPFLHIRTRTIRGRRTMGCPSF
jgi:hypothetical protein